VYAQFRDAAGNASSSASDTITLDLAAPSGTVVLDGGASWATSTSVTLTLSATDATSGVAQMRFSADGTTWSTWETYATSKSWTLADSDGTKTVYAQFRDGAGNGSSAVNDTILLDRVGPSGTAVVDGGASWTSSTSVTLTLAATDAGSGMAQMRFSADASTWSAWETYATSKSHTLADSDGTKTVYAQFRDGAGNASSNASDTIALDRAAPSGTVSIDGGAAWTTSTSVTLTLSATDAISGVASMRLSADGTTWSGWETYAASKSHALADPDGTKTVYAQFRDAAGNASSNVSDAIGLDRSGPSGTVIIDGGASWTTSASVTLTLSATDAASGVAQMRFSSDGSTWSTWETCATSKSRVLAESDGTQTVYAQFRDVAGNVSSTASDTIILDRAAPSGTVSIDGGASWATSTSVTLTLSATDATSGVATMRLSADGTNWSTWETYATSKSYTLADPDGIQTVHVQFRDAAGNASAAASDTIGLDRAAPTGTVIIDGGASWTTSTSVTLTLSASDTDSGVSQMRFSADGTNWSTWETSAASKSYKFADPDGTKTVFAQVRDAAGNASSTVSDTIGLDCAGPSGTVIIDGGASWTTSTSVTLTLSATDACSGLASMRFSTDGTTWSTWETCATSKSYTLADSDGTKAVYAQFRDVAGNPSPAVADAIGLDRAGPDGAIAIGSGCTATADPAVILTLSATDAGSGVATMRFSANGDDWTPWEAYAAARDWTFEGPDGPRTVFAGFRDAAGNLSAVVDVSIILDRTPAAAELCVNEHATYILPEEPILFTITAADETSGSGVREMRTSLDGGSHWSEWVPVPAGTALVVARAGAEGLVTAACQVRDAAGNISKTATARVFLVPASPPRAALKLNGSLEATGEVDVFSLDLTAGDTLSAKLTPSDRAVGLGLDVIGPCGTRLLDGCWPTDAPPGTVKRFRADATGRYLLVVRRGDESAHPGGGWALKQQVSRAKAPRGGPMLAGAYPFEAVAGTVVTASLHGALDPAALTLVGPDGPVPLEVTATRTSLRVSVVLSATGAYVFRFAGPGEPVCHLKLKIPSPPRGPLSAP
jgi:hypothetical protein